MPSTSDYYVYVYIDPRNHEEFYYGKGRGARKGAHLKDNVTLRPNDTSDLRLKRYQLH